MLVRWCGRNDRAIPFRLSGLAPIFDRIDALAADICATIKDHGESFESDDDLREWLDEDLISCSPEDLDAAIQHLEWIGRLKRPRQDHWDEDRPLPGIYMFRPGFITSDQDFRSVVRPFQARAE
jgi:hypothetical protein